MPAHQPSPETRFEQLSQKQNFDTISSFLVDFGRTALTDGHRDVLRTWCVSALPATGATSSDPTFRACTINAGKMEAAYIQMRDVDQSPWLLGCVYVRRTHFLAATRCSTNELRAQYDRLEFDPSVGFRAADHDALRIYADLTDPESVAQLDSLPWRDSARVLIDHLRTTHLMPKWSEAHSPDLADLIIGTA